MSKEILKYKLSCHNQKYLLIVERDVEQKSIVEWITSSVVPKKKKEFEMCFAKETGWDTFKLCYKFQSDSPAH